MLKLNPKLFLPIIFGVSAALKYAIDNNLVPVEYAGWAAMAASLFTGILQQAQGNASSSLPGFGDKSIDTGGES